MCPSQLVTLSSLMPFLCNVCLDTSLPAGDLAKHGLETGRVNLSFFRCFSWMLVSMTKGQVSPPQGHKPQKWVLFPAECQRNMVSGGSSDHTFCKKKWFKNGGFSGKSLRCLENLDLLGPVASPGTLEVPPLMSTA